MGSHLSRTLDYVGAGLAAGALKLGPTALNRRAAYHLQERLGRLRGLPQKIGQILSMSADPGSEAAFAPLRNGGPALVLAELLPALQSAWQRAPDEVCRSINGQGLAASLGQVHRAVLHNGREVAIKIRYPGIGGALETDLGALGWLSIPVGNLQRAFDLGAYRDVVRAGLEEELNYELEARNQEDLARAARGTGLVVPTVVQELSTESVLTTTWEAGEPLEAARTWTAEERKQLGRSLVQQFLTLTFEHGIVHADPHPGNYAFRRGTDGAQGVEVVLYDYGCVHRLSERERLALLALIQGTATRDAGSAPYQLLVELGFDADLLRPMQHKLPALCSVLFEPFAAQTTFDVSTWNRGARVSDLLGEDRVAFRAAGPPRLLYFLRAYEGLCFYLRELGQPVSWSQPLAGLLERHATALADLRPAEPVNPSATYGCLAQHLCIEVTENGEPRAQITLPAGAVERLEQFIDADLEHKIKARGIVMEELIERARANQYAPQEVFSMQDGSRTVEVHLR